MGVPVCVFVCVSGWTQLQLWVGLSIHTHMDLVDPAAISSEELVLSYIVPCQIVRGDNEVVAKRRHPHVLHFSITWSQAQRHHHVVPSRTHAVPMTKHPKALCTADCFEDGTACPSACPCLSPSVSVHCTFCIHNQLHVASVGPASELWALKRLLVTRNMSASQYPQEAVTGTMQRPQSRRKYCHGGRSRAPSMTRRLAFDRFCHQTSILSISPHSNALACRHLRLRNLGHPLRVAHACPGLSGSCHPTLHPLPAAGRS